MNNASDSALLKATLSCPVNNDGFQVHIETASPRIVRAHRSVVWPVRVTNVGSARVPGSIVFAGSYTSASTGAEQLVFATLNITAAADATQKPIEASLEGTFDAVSENRPGTGYLLLMNNLNVEVNVAGLVIRHPPSIKAVENFVPFKVAARSTGSQKIQLEAESKVTPGKYPVLLDLTIEWDWGGHRESRHLIATKQVGVGVFFESELLKVLGVPSFLLLPGCLFLFTMQLLVTLGVLGVKNESRLPQLPITSPGFWIIAVTFSALFAYAYNWRTGTNYLERYGVDDLRNVWLASIVIGAFTYFFIALLTVKRRNSRVPTAGDDPVTILKKMSKNGVGIEIVPVKFLLGKLDYWGFPVERITDEQKLLWVVPKIVTNWQDSEGARTAQKRFEDQVNDRNKPLELANTLAAAVQANQVSVSWSDNPASIPIPYHLKVETVTGYLPRELIV